MANNNYSELADRWLRGLSGGLRIWADAQKVVSLIDKRFVNVELFLCDDGERLHAIVFIDMIRRTITSNIANGTVNY